MLEPVLPGVTVTATQEATAVAATAVTNESGQFVFPNLKIGTYKVAAELQRFKRAVRSARSAIGARCRWR